MRAWGWLAGISLVSRWWHEGGPEGALARGSCPGGRTGIAPALPRPQMYQ